MSEAEHATWKPVKVASIVLARAARRIGAPLDREIVAFERTSVAEVEEERRRALGELEHLIQIGAAAHARGGFWRDLMRACEALGLEARLEEMRERFSQALRETRPESTEDAG